MKQSSILIVDDTPATLRLLHDMLTKAGYKSTPLSNGELALRAAEIEQPDLILLGIDLPDMDGCEVCRRLKANEKLRSIPVIFISALAETIDKLKAFQVGAVDYLTTPFYFQEVVARIETHLNLRRLQSELELRNRLLEEYGEKLHELETLRDSLTHMIVHDMRSPLCGISGSLELLGTCENGELSDEGQENLMSAANATGILLEMVSSLLDVHKLEAGKMQLQLAQHDLRDIVHSAIGLLGKRSEFRVKIHVPPVPVTVRCDGGLIRRVVLNLVGNALRFTPTTGRVDVHVASRDRSASVEVADTGYGIPAQYHKQIFEKFGQVEIRQEGHIYSTGLGLTFCKLVVEAHGGSIGVESEVGKGSTFRFDLPDFPTMAQRDAGPSA